MDVSHWRESHLRVVNALEKCEALKPSWHRVYELEELLERHSCWKEANELFQHELGQDAEALLLDFYFHPAAHPITDSSSTIASIVCFGQSFLEWYFIESATPAFAEGLIQRSRQMLERPIENIEISDETIVSEYLQEGQLYHLYLHPKLSSCLGRLHELCQLPNVKQFLVEVYSGVIRFNTEPLPEEMSSKIESGLIYFLGHDPENLFNLLRQLQQDQSLTEELLLKIAQRCPWLMRGECIVRAPFVNDYERDESPAELAFQAEYKSLLSSMLKKQLGVLTNVPDWMNRLTELWSDHVNKPLYWMELGLQKIEQAEERGESINLHYGVVRSLIACAGLVPGETDDDLHALLQRFKHSTLLQALPYAAYARTSILQIVGWQELLPLQRALYAIAGATPSSTCPFYDVANDDDPDTGVVDRAELQQAIEGVRPEILDEYLDILSDSGTLTNTLWLWDAFVDEDRSFIEKKLTRHMQLAIRAYGLYPVVDEAELRARYLTFKTIHKDAMKYGAERQRNTQAAVAAGLKNLAQAAGYSDENRLEWAMESQIALELLAFNQWFEAEAWQVRLVIKELSLQIEVQKDGKTLKSVPAGLRKTEIYQQLRTAQETFKSQISRFRRTLENMMCMQEQVTAAELQSFLLLPSLRVMLRQLILRTETGQLGMLNDEGTHLIQANGEPLPLEGAFAIAHVQHLFANQELAAWQKRIVHERRVQPFKQAFRELYVLTPAEEECVDHSLRFAGHRTDGAVTSRLLQQRQWKQSTDDGSLAYKWFGCYQQGAQIFFVEECHFLAEADTLTVDEIQFYVNQQALPLNKVDPILFSEVMRDVDLLVSVASGESAHPVTGSVETIQRRIELINELILALDWKNVHCEDHFAYIEGQLAQYRIHLGSGVIHIQPGNYLCIVPAREKEEAIYLPFADADTRTAEIVSKIFLLKDDQLITDPSILSQIK